jgi:outer membrane scaffolding protein for murein synthesis (MipA/OmpV family)
MGRLLAGWLATLGLLAASSAAAQQPERRPLVELGIAAGGGWRPDYPAAGEGHLAGIAVPFVILRSDILRTDEGGARGRLLRSAWGELSLSATGATPTRSAGNAAREGMPDLGWMGEIGPALRLGLWRHAASRQRLTLDIPLRAVFEADTDPVTLRWRGVSFAPELAWEQRSRGARLRLSLGPIFGTERLLDTYYEVGPAFARPSRPAYDARGGYLGTRLQLSYRLPVTERLSVVIGGRAEGYWGAANQDSPLFRRETGLSVAAGFSWSLHQSARTVDASAEPFD